MKAIMMSIRPQHVANILNGLKTLEIRKKFPKDYVGWVYIYVTKGKPYLSSNSFGYYVPKKYEKYMGNCNGKVVARFWCDKVEEIEVINYDSIYRSATIYCCDYIGQIDLLKKSCLSFDQIFDYLKDRGGCAIHIAKLEIFDEPKEISEFSIKVFPHRKDNLMTRYLTRAPQSYCFIEV